MENILRAQKKASTAELVPSFDTRVDRLNKCIALLKDYEAKIVKALQLDFKSRSSQEIIISEVDQSIRNLRFTIKSLRRWMKPITRQSSFGAGLLGAQQLGLRLPTSIHCLALSAARSDEAPSGFEPTESEPRMRQQCNKESSEHIADN